MMQRKLYTGLLVALGCSLGLFWGKAWGGTIPVEPHLGTGEITRMLHSAVAGDTLLFAAGTYTGPFLLQGLHGDPNLPVVILGEGHGQTVIDGQALPASDAHHEAFVLKDCSWISIEGFTIRNCWTDLVVAENSSYLSLSHCNLEGGKRALYARGRGSHHFLVEQCTWEQDERVWTHQGDFSWEEIHHGIHEHYNGSLFLGSKISGGFVLRDNVVRNTFNAFRLSNIAEGDFDPLACTNGEIYRNTVWNTSDNVLEPEVHALNLHYYHNRMVNGHAFVSVTEVRGGQIYIYGNTAVSLPDSDDGWTIFKISSRTDSLDAALYIFNNSWQVDFDMVGSPRNLWENSHVVHFNNACFSEASDTFGIYHLGDHNRFDYDCSNVPFPVLLTGQGHEENGIVADPQFRGPYENDFRLEDSSPCIDRGKNDSTLILSFRGESPDIGAWDNGGLIEGVPFRYVEPGAEVPYKEMPRIVRHRWEGLTFKLWFSVPLSKESVDGLKAALQTGAGRYPLGPPDLSEDGYCLSFATRSMETAYSLHLSKWPAGTNGMTMTRWAGTLPVTVGNERENQKVRDPDPVQVLATTRSVADKVIRETSFQFRMVPFTFNAGVSHLHVPSRFDGCNAPAGAAGLEGSYCDALMRIDSEKAAGGYIGLSYEGRIELFLNGEPVFRGTSRDAVIREYTYNRFSFMERIPVEWARGENRVVVRCDVLSGPATLLLMPVDETDAMPGFLKTVPALAGVPGLDWTVEGPRDVPGGSEKDPPAGGEEGGPRKLQEVPLIPELCIDPANSYTRDSYLDWNYANGGTLLGMLSLYDASGDSIYLDHLRHYLRTLAENMERFRLQYSGLHAFRGSYHRIFRMTMLDDTGGPAIPLAEAALREPLAPELLFLLDSVSGYVLQGQERLEDGTFCRPEPEPATVWADDLFMSVPFLLRMADLRGDQSLYDEVARQVIRFNQYLKDEATGLYFHGWYDRRGENTPVRWGRANGWIVWATSEALLHMPAGHPDYGAILGIYRDHLEALALFQDTSGLWHQVLDHPETYLETSCTAMFTLGFARGVRMGWLPAKYRENAVRGWQALQGKVRADGTVVDICRGTEIGDSPEWYNARSRMDHDPRGLGAVLTAGCEIYRLLLTNPF